MKLAGDNKLIKRTNLEIKLNKIVPAYNPLITIFWGDGHVLKQLKYDQRFIPENEGKNNFKRSNK